MSQERPKTSPDFTHNSASAVPASDNLVIHQINTRHNKKNFKLCDESSLCSLLLGSDFEDIHTFTLLLFAHILSRNPTPNSLDDRLLLHSLLWSSTQASQWSKIRSSL